MMIPKRLPIRVNFTASTPNPSIRSLWPGSRAITSSEAPRKTEGTASTIEFVTATQTRKTQAKTGSKDIEATTTAIRLVWIPGVRPQKIPTRTPSRAERITEHPKT